MRQPQTADSRQFLMNYRGRITNSRLLASSVTMLAINCGLYSAYRSIMVQAYPNLGSARADLQKPRCELARWHKRNRLPANFCYAENISSSPRTKGGNVRWVSCRPDPASRIQPARLRRGRALTEACSSSERQRSITSMLKRHSEPTRKPGSCLARSNRYTVVGCTRRYSDNSRTVSTVGGVGAEPDFFDRFSSTLTL